MRKQRNKNKKFFVGHCGDTRIAKIMVGYDKHRGSINDLAVDPAVTGVGYGRVWVLTAEAFLLSVECSQIYLVACHNNGAVVTFYYGP